MIPEETREDKTALTERGVGRRVNSIRNMNNSMKIVQVFTLKD